MASSNESETRRRLRRRAELVLPDRPAAVFTADEPAPDLSGVDVVGAVRRESDPPLPGFAKVFDRRHRHAVPLHRVLGAIHPALGRPFGPAGVFHHVGGRLCARPAPGFREECWVRDDVAPQAKRSAASPVALAGITAGGLGFLPVIGATAASFATALLAWLLGLAWEWEAVRLGMGALALITTLASLGVERIAARHFLTDDPREFVLDEVAGMAVALLFVPAAHWAAGVAVAFAAFRFFDVLKPGIAWVERRGWRGTIVWDDLLAGLYAGVATFAVVTLLSKIA